MNKLRGMPERYRIKLKSSGFRLVYQVIDDKVVVFVVSAGKRERLTEYTGNKTLSCRTNEA